MNTNGKVAPPVDTHQGESLTPTEGAASYGSSTKILNEQKRHHDDDDDVEAGCCSGRNGWCGPETRAWAVIAKLTAVLLAGIMFGWCLEKARVFAPASMRLQMVFERWIMLKMFLAAVASGQLVMCIISVIPATKERFQSSLDSYACCFNDKGVLSSLLGPFILGCGITLSGACPGMVLAQVGSWTKNAYLTFIGTLIGALIYGLVAPYIIKLIKPKKPFEKQAVHQKFGLPYFAIALPMCVLIVVTVFLMEWFIPWVDDLDEIDQAAVLNTTNTNIFTVKAWPPSIAGVVVGLLQLVIIFSVGDTMGGSSSYVTIVSQWVVTERLQQVFPYLARARCGLGNWWQVFYVSGAVLGGCFSASASSSLATQYGANVPTALCGGVLMLIGSRMAAGCTSGHGLSGMGLLFWVSFIAVPAMFAGGIVVGFSMKATGALTDWSYF